MGVVQFGHLTVSRIVIGGNPFSGFSHQSPQKDEEMREYYTTERIKETLRLAEAGGITTFLGRADRHIQRVLLEYWKEGGTIQWLAQTCPEYASPSRSISEAIRGGASAVYLHGGTMDYLYAQDQLDQVPEAIAQIHDAGLPAGLAAHQVKILEWAEENVDVDFYMTSYYNPSNRDRNAEHVSGAKEHFLTEDRDAMVRAIQHLSKPAIHYKIFAAGRTDPRQAFSFVAKHLRPQDAVCLGIYTKDNPDMIQEDLRLFEESLQEPVLT
jgi:hypothetical protein